MAASTDTVKLTYFDGRGVIEPTRIMLSIAKVSYEDFRYPIDISIYSKPEFDAAKAEGKFALNMGRAPLFEINGVEIAQSKTIDRYVARKYGFSGDSDIEAAHIDMIAEHVSDIKKSYGDARSGKKGDEAAAAKSEWLSTKLPEWTGKLEASIAMLGGTGGFSVGKKLSYADIRLYEMTCDFFDDKDAAAAAIASCPKISASVDAVKSAAADWLASRPVTAI